MLAALVLAVVVDVTTNFAALMVVLPVTLALNVCAPVHVGVMVRSSCVEVSVPVMVWFAFQSVGWTSEVSPPSAIAETNGWVITAAIS